MDDVGLPDERIHVGLGDTPFWPAVVVVVVVATFFSPGIPSGNCKSGLTTAESASHPRCTEAAQSQEDERAQALLKLSIVGHGSKSWSNPM